MYSARQHRQPRLVSYEGETWKIKETREGSRDYVIYNQTLRHIRSSAGAQSTVKLLCSELRGKMMNGTNINHQIEFGSENE
jgi:hypothetical protein